MVEQYSKMQEFRDYMDEAILVGEDIMRQLPDTYGISIVVKDIESALNPLQNKPEDNSKTLKNITEILENKFSHGKNRQKCPDLDKDRQVPCMMEQLYLTALRLEALKHYERSRAEESDYETKPMNSTCDVFTTTYNLISK